MSDVEKSCGSKIGLGDDSTGADSSTYFIWVRRFQSRDLKVRERAMWVSTGRAFQMGGPACAKAQGP